jgi:hypothetical protein
VIVMIVMDFVLACRSSGTPPGGSAMGGMGGISTGGRSGAASTLDDGSDDEGGAGTASARGGAGSPSNGGATMAGASGSTAMPDAGSATGGEAPGQSGGGGEAGASAGCDPTCSPTQTCEAGTCIDQDCQPGASFCSGNSVRTCAADGLSSTQKAVCPGGDYCDPASAGCKVGYPNCPNVYLGSGRFGDNPQPVSEANDAIRLNSYDVPMNTLVFGQLRAFNLGSDDSPISHLELYLSESPGFATNNDQLIFETNAVIPGAALGGDIGEYDVNWSHTFTKAGHYVLLARVKNDTHPTDAACPQQAYDSSSPTTDSMTAVHYIHVVE